MGNKSQNIPGFIPEQTFIVEKEHMIIELIKPCSAKGDQVFTPSQFWVLLQSSEPPEEKKIGRFQGFQGYLVSTCSSECSAPSLESPVLTQHCGS